MLSRGLEIAPNRSGSSERSDHSEPRVAWYGFGMGPEIAAVARELGLSDRTLQRRIVDDGTTFRHLLLEARQELAREYLNRPEIDVAEVAYLLGYEDANSFYRAFRTWEGTTPAQLRSALKRSDN
jgi:AraC-like DNA-binding protein